MFFMAVSVVVLDASIAKGDVAFLMTPTSELLL
jgi:hypothetical protein